jgi:hypothetical protein
VAVTVVTDAVTMSLTSRSSTVMVPEVDRAELPSVKETVVASPVTRATVGWSFVPVIVIVTVWSSVAGVPASSVAVIV